MVAALARASDSAAAASATRSSSRASSASRSRALVVDVAQPLGLGGRPFAVGDDRRFVVAVAPLERVDHAEPLLHRGDGRRVVVDALGQRPRFHRHVRELRLETGQPLRQRLVPWIDAGDTTGLAQGDRRGLPRAARPSPRSASWTAAAPRAIASPCWAAASRARSSSTSPGPEARPGDLGRLVLEHLEPSGELAGVGDELVERRAVGPPRIDGRGHRRPGRPVPPERVEQVTLPASVEEALLVVLSVDLDERADLIGQPCGRHGLVVEPRRRTARGRHLADRDDRLGQAVEERLDPGDLGAMPDQARVGAGTGDEAERIDEQALAGPGLAGDHVEPGLERETDPLDDREVGDGEFEQSPGHDGSSATLRRSRSQNGTAPLGSMSRSGRSTALTSTTSPTWICMSSRPSIETRASCASTTRQRTVCSGLTTTERMAER